MLILFTKMLKKKSMTFCYFLTWRHGGNKKNMFSFNEFILLTNLKINGIRKRNTLMNSPVTEWVFLTWNKKRKDNLETLAAFIEISILKFTKRLKTPWNTFEKYGFLWRESAIFRLFSCASGWNERWYASIYKEMELEMDCLTSRMLLQKASSCNYQFCTKVYVSSRLVSQV